MNIAPPPLNHIHFGSAGARQGVKANEDASLGGCILVLYGSQSSPLQTMGRKGSPTARLRNTIHGLTHAVHRPNRWRYRPGRSTFGASHPGERGPGDKAASPASATCVTPSLINSRR